MKERPMPFTGENVVAILEDRKTMTRRTRGLDTINKDPDNFVCLGSDFSEAERLAFCIPGLLYFKFKSKDNTKLYHSKKNVTYSIDTLYIKCPYGIVGDLLWVRETYAILYPDKPVNPLYYKADGVEEDVKWKSSMFMPRWASRINLENTTIRCERLQDISYEDIIEEGFSVKSTLPTAEGTTGEVARKWYQKLWDSINGKKHSWESNPFVWVIKFKKL